MGQGKKTAQHKGQVFGGDVRKTPSILTVLAQCTSYVLTSNDILPEIASENQSPAN
jgi:hypothetical protein